MVKAHKVRFFLLTALMLPAVSESSQPIELTLSYQINPTPPYQMGTGVDVVEPPGIALDVINAAAKELELTINYKRYPNVRVLHLLENGLIDGAFMFSFKPERTAFARYPVTAKGELDTDKRLATLSYWLYTKTGKSLDWNGERFSHTNGLVAAEHGDSIIDDLEKKGLQILQPESAYKALLLLVKRPQVFGAAIQDMKADPLLKQPEFQGIVRAPLPLKTKDYFLVLSHQFVDSHPEIATALWQKIEELREDVTKESMYRYIAFERKAN